MFYWIYDIPGVLVLALFGATFVGICWLGILLLTPRLAGRVHGRERMNETLGDFLQYFGVFYGLLLGLLAVSTYQNHSDAEKAVANEASSLAALYRDVSIYPEPDRGELEVLIKEYTRHAIEDAWPLQRIGVVPEEGIKRAAAIQFRLAGFEPQTKGQEAIHETALRQFNTFFEDRRTRLYTVDSGIPLIMWVTVAVGAAINIFIIWLFHLPRGVHLLLGGLISFYTATMICLIALLDNPYRGEVGVSPEAFQLVYDHLMK